ncbi:MAG: beta/gamma crystallin-related protein [Micropepsaceae bacterium]
MKKFAVAASAIAVVASAAVAVAQPYYPAAATVAPPAPPPAVITVFDQPNFKGRKLIFDQMVPSLAKIDFNDVIASVQIKGRDWVLCEHRNFMGKCVRIRAKEKDLKRLKINGQVSSLYPVPITPPAPPKPR